MSSCVIGSCYEGSQTHGGTHRKGDGPCGSIRSTPGRTVSHPPLSSDTINRMDTDRLRLFPVVSGNRIHGRRHRQELPGIHPHLGESRL